MMLRSKLHFHFLKLKLFSYYIRAEERPDPRRSRPTRTPPGIAFEVYGSASG